MARAYRARLRVLPTNAERAAWFRKERTSVPEQVERVTLCRRAFEWTWSIVWTAEEGIVALWKKVFR